MDIVFNGIVSGVVLAFLIGPVFFSIIQTSIERGFRSGVFVAIGVSLSDTFYISVCYLGVYQIFDRGNFREYLAYFGGIVLILFGIYYVFIKTKKPVSYDHHQLEPTPPIRLVLKGFVINGLTPMVFIFWIGAVVAATTKFNYQSPGKAIPYFAAMVGTVFITDVIKAKLADKLRAVLTPKFIRNLNILVGILLMVFGARLIAMAENFNGF
jgi:threonine/homoserine/homoserine lactone efflux protein